VVKDAGFMISLNVAETVVLPGTLPAPAVGVTVVTEGAEVSAVVPVLKLHRYSTPKGTPVALLTPVVTTAVYAVLGCRLAAGVKTAVRFIAS
jgi:hypothetical protein